MSGFVRPAQLRHSLEVFVPTFNRHGQRISSADRRAVLAKVKGLVIDWAGGCTTTFGVGSWKASSAHVVDEPVSIVAAYSAVAVPLGLLGELVELVMNQLDQEAVALVSDGALLMYERPAAGEEAS